MSRAGRTCRPLVAPHTHRELTIFEGVAVVRQILDSTHGKFLVSTEHRVYALDMSRRLIVEAPIDPDRSDGAAPTVSPRFNLPISLPRSISRVHQCREGRLLYLTLGRDDGVRDQVYFAPHITMILLVPHIPEEWIP